MQELMQKLVQRWSETGAKPRPGFSSAALASFTLPGGRSLPRDFAAMYEATDGIEDDGNLFALWPLAEVGRVPDRLSDFRGIPNYEGIAQTLPDAAQYVVFADYMIWSHVPRQYD